MDSAEMTWEGVESELVSSDSTVEVMRFTDVKTEMYNNADADTVVAHFVILH